MLESGIKTNLSDTPSLVVGGVTYTPSEAIAKVDSFLAVQTNAANAKNAYHTAITNEKTSNLAARTFRAQMHGYCIARYGADSPKLAEFSFTPAKPKKSLVTTKAIAAAKTKAARVARNTMGKKQKLKIKGSVDPKLVEALGQAQHPAAGAHCPAVPPGPAPAIGARG